MNIDPINPPTKYYKALDGLRGYAVLMVLFYHANYISWGWIGVHIFFVLSGFLITGILLASKGKPDYYKSFFVKRISRIFPIYYLMLFATVAWSLYRNFTISDAWMYAIFIQNFKLGLNNMSTNFTDWFDHTWTLAVEEQFYLIFPFIVAGLHLRAFRITCYVFIIVGILAIITFPLLYSSNAMNVKNTIPCLPFLCGGALLAVENTEYGKRNTKLLLLVSSSFVICLLLAFFTLSIPGDWYVPHTPKGQLSLITSFPLIVLLVQYLIRNRTSVVRLLFENKIIVYLGKISYGLYLYHSPLFVICFGHKIPPAIPLVITFILAVLSWHLVEKKFIGLRDRVLSPKPAQLPF